MGEARRGGPANYFEGADGLPAYLHSRGYVNVVAATGSMAEHKYVMEKHLGRQMRAGESVHHRNGIKSDNRLDNLELWVIRQPAGQRVSDLVEFVAQQYPAEVLAAIADAGVTR